MSPNGSVRRAYVPFTMADLFNWKTHTASYSSDPERIGELFAGIMLSHQLTWGDVMHLMVWKVAKKYATNK